MPDQIGKYKIVRELGKGAMGCVYKAFDPDTENFVALKVLFRNQEQEQTQRFHRETKAMAKMNHRNIVKVYVCEQDRNCMFFTMDYIKGTTLREFIKHTKLNIRLFSQTMVKISKAIAYAHKQGVIHRDLKPGNILLDTNREPYITDFGLTKLVEVQDKSLTKKGAILGTPMYMSPEQANAQEVNHLTDVYALGAIFYEMLTKKPLVEGKNTANILFNVIHQEPVLLRKVNHKLSKDLETICYKSVAKNASDRYQSAQEFAEDIERFLQGKIITARTASVWERFYRKLYKNRWGTIVAILGILTIAIAIWIFENTHNIQIHANLTKVKEWQQKAILQKNIFHKMEVYTKINNLLEKTLEISPKIFIKKELIKVQKEMGILAKKQKNYLLSFTFFKRCQNLGDQEAQKLLKQLEQEKYHLQKKQQAFIAKIMQKILQNKMLPNALLDRYAFTIIRMKKPYIVKTLIPYLESKDKEQRLFAIKTLGKFGNTYTKFKNKDVVQWLLKRLAVFKNKAAKNQKEVEEIIWALGWLKDGRANNAVYEIRFFDGENSTFWNRTQLPYKWIPLETKKLKEDAEEFRVRGMMKEEKGDYHGAMDDFNKAIELAPKDAKAYNNRAFIYQRLQKYTKAIADFNKAIKFNPCIAFYNNRANIYQRLKKYAKAIADYNKIIKVNPALFEIYSNRANTYKEMGKYKKAIVDHNKAIELNPKYSESYNNRAILYQEIKEYTKAIADSNKAIQLNPRHSNSYHNRANIYYEIKKYKKAIVDYSKVIELTPRSPDVYYNRALAYQKLKKHGKAIVDYNKAIKLNSTNSDVYNDRALAYQEIKEHTKAIADYSKAIKLSPENFRIYNNRANAYLEIKEYTKAIVDYNKAAELNPNYPNTYYNRANTYHQMQEYKKAIGDYNKTIELDPKYPNSYNSRAITYHYVHKYKKAISDYSKAIELNPNYSEAYSNRSISYRYMREYSKAIFDCNKAIELDPKYPDAYHNRALIYQYIQEYKKAILDCNKIIKIAPKNPVGYSTRAISYYHMQEYEKAILDCNKAIKLNPKFLEAYINRSAVYQAKKEYTKAFIDYSKAIELNPKHPDAYYNRGYAYQAKREYTKAFIDYNKAIELNPKFAKAYYCRGYIYQIKKEYKRAIVDYSKVIELNPKFANIYYTRGCVYQMVKEYSKAMIDYNKSLEKNANSKVYYNKAMLLLNMQKHQKAYQNLLLFLKWNPKHAMTTTAYAIINDLKRKNLIK